jgi:biopolymer transport protein ExbD
MKEEIKLMRLPDEPEPPLQINVVPMIDVMFALLTFFIMSSLFLTRSQGLPVNLPQAGTAQQQPSTPITVTLDQKGDVSLNRQPVALNALPEQVRKLIGSDQEALVIINADERVTHGQVVAVMDRLRQVQGARLAIAAQKP